VLNAPDCPFFSMLLSIAVHIHSVFCVPCTVCDIVQQLSFRSNYSVVPDAVYLQYTCTDGAVSVTCTTRYRTHVHVRKYSVEMIYVILGKRLENIWLKTVKQRVTWRKKNKLHTTVWLWIMLTCFGLGVWKCKGLRDNTIVEGRRLGRWWLWSRDLDPEIFELWVFTRQPPHHAS